MKHKSQKLPEHTKTQKSKKPKIYLPQELMQRTIAIFVSIDLCFDIQFNTQGVYYFRHYTLYVSVSLHAGSYLFPVLL